MARSGGLEFPDLERQLYKLRRLMINPRRVRLDHGAELCTYIEALKILNAEISNLLKRFLRDQRSREKRLSARKPYQIRGSRVAPRDLTEQSRGTSEFPRWAGSTTIRSDR